jgi:hypothetical protein
VKFLGEGGEFTMKKIKINKATKPGTCRYVIVERMPTLRAKE